MDLIAKKRFYDLTEKRYIDPTGETFTVDDARGIQMINKGFAMRANESKTSESYSPYSTPSASRKKATDSTNY